FNEITLKLFDAEEAFKETADYLNEMAHAAQDIANGNLNANVKRRSENDILGNSIANMISKIKNANKEISVQINRLKILNNIDSRILSTLDLQSTLSYVLKEVSAHLNVDLCEILMYNPEKFLFYAFSECRKNDTLLFDSKSVINTPYLKNILLETRSINFDNFTTNLNFNKIILENGITSFLAIPLITRRELRGALVIANRSLLNFTEESIDFLRMLVDQSSIAINSVELVANLEKKVSERTAELIKNQKTLERKNFKIMESIFYAKRIQTSLLPEEKDIVDATKDFFLLWTPKDVVGGDFFWFKKVDKKQYLFAVIDCAGHGVPGALMTMIVNAALNRIVEEQRLCEPDKILKELNNIVKRALN
ncbi:MAG TPA: GAF domain-containing protein, partial [Spirochaetota bacterium]|nr:GAF domain-containing protein [Spirochaetota bacterium]